MKPKHIEMTAFVMRHEGKDWKEVVKWCLSQGLVNTEAGTAALAYDNCHPDYRSVTYAMFKSTLGSRRESVIEEKPNPVISYPVGADLRGENSSRVQREAAPDIFNN